MSVRPRVYISAAHKSSGKTTLSIGLTAALSRRGHQICPFKKGPDYIDPMWLARAAGRPCYNLDFNTQSRDEILDLFARKSFDDCISLIEGNKGLYDGVDIEGDDSNAALAKELDAPVILVLDATGITRGVAPLVLGYQSFDEKVQIKGVILNKVGGARVEGKLRAVLERYTDVRVLGAVRRDEALEVRERHLGLTPPGEVGPADDIVALLAERVAASVDLDEVASIAQSASPLEFEIKELPAVETKSPVRIGVARDAAFGFYYADDLEALEREGAEIVYFSALDDERLPDMDGLFIGGGFPETQMGALSKNASLRNEIADAARKGMPIYAECGGLMYLTRSISWAGEKFDMVGILDADTVMNEKPQGRGLVVLAAGPRHPWQGMEADSAAPAPFAAHEFHYASLENVSEGLDYAYEVQRGTGIDGRRDGIVWNKVLANFAHLRQTGQCKWARHFVEFVRQNRAERK